MIKRGLHTANVLWLIREGIATTWTELCAYFDAQSSEKSRLLSQLDELHSAKLIEIEGEEVSVDSIRGVRFPQFATNISFLLTPLALEVLNALDISLVELAHSEPSDRNN
jgi:hypothetical protein